MRDRADSGEAFGKAVRVRRKALRLTQEEAAELAGVAVRTVHAIEASKPTVRLDALLAVLGALGLQLTLERGNAPGALQIPSAKDGPA